MLGGVGVNQPPLGMCTHSGEHVWGSSPAELQLQPGNRDCYGQARWSNVYWRGLCVGEEGYI